MARGGRAKDRDAPERRCIVSGDSGPKAGLIRFVIDPDGRVTPDVVEKLPGRGIWVSADRSALERAMKKNLFARAARRQTSVDPGLADLVEAQLTRRAVEAIALCRKAGSAVGGFEKTREAAPNAVALLSAADAAAGGRAKLRRLARDLPMITCLTSAELGLAFGRPSVINAALTFGGAADRALRETERLQGFRQVDPGSAGVEPAEAAPR